MTTFSRIFKIFANLILAGLIVLGILVVFSFIPFPGKIQFFVVQSGSMEPAVKTGSLIFVVPKEGYAVGDIITKKTADSESTITHRITSQGEEGGRVFFETKGDANDAPDGDKVFPEDILGRTFLAVPFLGYAVDYAKTPQGLILLIVVPAVIIIYDELGKIKREIAVILEKRRLRKTDGNDSGQI